MNFKTTYKDIVKRSIILLSILLFSINLNAQVTNSEDRFVKIEKQLEQLSKTEPGLSEKIELSVSDLDIQEFIRAIANANKINIHISPDLNMKISNNFSNVSVSSVLSFLCRQYDLNIDFYNNILSISRWHPEPEKPVIQAPKEIDIRYNPNDGTISMDLDSDTLSKVAKEITKKTGRNILYGPSVSNHIVSFFVENIALDNAIDKLALTNGLQAIPTEDNCILLDKETSTTDNNNGSSSRSRSSKKHKSHNADFEYTIENDLISLNAENASINDIVTEISNEMKKNFIVYTPITGEITTRLDKVSYDEFLNKILNSSKFTSNLSNGLYMIGDRQIENLRETRVIQLQHRSTNNIQEYIPKEIQKDVTIKEFPELNSIIASGSSRSIDEVENFLISIDKVVPVILIEVIMISSNVYNTTSTGISFGSGTEAVKSSLTYNGGISTTLSSKVLNDIISGINSWGSFFNLGKVNSSFYMSLSALEDQGVVKVHSTPKLATLNSHEATLVIGETEYYKEVQNTVVGNENPQNIQSYEWKSIDANLSISIKPMYSGDDQITMEVKVAQSGFKQTAGKDAPPGSENKTFSSTMRVRNEEMILLGGLEEKSKSNTGSGLPVLSRVPVLRWIFSNRTKSKEDSQLNIFIRPTILF